jgi:4-carboxymuconolactone decarboxylase
MTDSSNGSTTRRARGLDVIGTLSGSDDPASRADALISELGPIGSYVIDHVLGTVWARPELSRRDRSLIVISMLISIAQLRQLATHVKGGLNHGLTPDEVREVAVHLCGYVGFPRAIEAMRVINKAIEDEMGDATPAMVPADVIDDEKRHVDGIEIFRHLTETPDGPDIDTRISELEDVLGPMAAVAFDWGFGELWTRPQLSQRDRSLLIVAMLAVTGRDSQLQFHVPGALNNGVSVSELKEVMLMVSIYGGFPPAASAMRIVHELT